VGAGHPPPLVFSRGFDCFVEVRRNRLVSCPPIGLQADDLALAVIKYRWPATAAAPLLVVSADIRAGR
jgi:hypothetical protein